MTHEARAVKNSVANGAGVGLVLGGAVGLIVGAQIGNPSQGSLVGTGLGLVLGAGVGAWIEARRKSVRGGSGR